MPSGATLEVLYLTPVPSPFAERGKAMSWLRKGVWTVVAVATFVVLVRTFPAMSSILAMVLVVAIVVVALYG